MLSIKSGEMALRHSFDDEPFLYLEASKPPIRVLARKGALVSV